MSYVPKKTSKKSFTHDIAALLYAHGDVDSPDAQTVAVLEDILVNYLTDISFQLLAIASRNPATSKKSLKKIKVEDLCFILRNDPLKLSRAKELIVQQKVIQNARRQDLSLEDRKAVELLLDEGNKKRKADKLKNEGKKYKKKKKKAESSDEEEDEEEDDDDDEEDD